MIIEVIIIYESHKWLLFVSLAFFRETWSPLMNESEIFERERHLSFRKQNIFLFSFTQGSPSLSRSWPNWVTWPQRVRPVSSELDALRSSWSTTPSPTSSHLPWSILVLLIWGQVGQLLRLYFLSLALVRIYPGASNLVLVVIVISLNTIREVSISILDAALMR